MEIVVVSEQAMRQLREAQERHELEELRASLRITSLADAQKRFETVNFACETMLHMAEEAYANLDDDPFDDWETAKAKADKIDKIERDHARCVRAWETQAKRVNWESRQANL